MEVALMPNSVQPIDVAAEGSESKDMLHGNQSYHAFSGRTVAPLQGRGRRGGRSGKSGRGHKNHSSKQDRNYLAHMAAQQIEAVFDLDSLCMDTYLRSYMDVEGYVPVALLCGYPNVAASGASYYDVLQVLQSRAETNQLELDLPNETIRLKEKWNVWLMPNGQGGFGLPRYIKQQQLPSLPEQQHAADEVTQGADVSDNSNMPPATADPVALQMAMQQLQLQRFNQDARSAMPTAADQAQEPQISTNDETAQPSTDAAESAVTDRIPSAMDPIQMQLAIQQLQLQQLQQFQHLQMQFYTQIAQVAAQPVGSHDQSNDIAAMQQQMQQLHLHQQYQLFMQQQMRGQMMAATQQQMEQHSSSTDAIEDESADSSNE